MKSILEYKGYHTKIEFYAESMSLRGKIEGIDDYVDFETSDISKIETEFHAAVDDYLDFCKEVGKKPEKEYKGTFNVRITPELHKQIALCAFSEDCSLNSAVEKAIEEYVDKNKLKAYAILTSENITTEKVLMDDVGFENETVVSNNVVPFRTDFLSNMG